MQSLSLCLRHLHAARVCTIRSIIPTTIVRAFSTTRFNRDGLGDFFDDQHAGWRWKDDPLGRPWEASELRNKSFEDLHKLWYVCIKEQNLLASQAEEARRYRLVFPHVARMKRLRMTMSRIKLVLWERHQQYNQALNIVTREAKREELLQQMIARQTESSINPDENQSTGNVSTDTVDEVALEQALAQKMPYKPPSEKVKKILEEEQRGPRRPRHFSFIKPKRQLNNNPSISKFIV
ncbi:hypothetical protein SeMB42_g01771 [Synchytrium endobioticum]|uniref:Large ribosomal subunit protein uL29m n=1 Tax=Synchytrium endobioticum TaxID=286115 RepID=A0A507D9B7_9FUNG|nr:hypothetical protein SeLEV6574_g02204 [Synchytrium endobioticum]TPX51914.1 hypothetical protein SeMB42_g01771 [Synchytrium endobioticum]